jgi:hypothetical protein
MPTKTKTEFETVEKEIEYTECDVPGCFNTDEETEMVDLAVNPRYDVKEEPEYKIVKEFDEMCRAKAYLRKKRTKASCAVGYRNRTNTKNARCDVNFFVCHHCLSHVLGVDIDPEKVTDAAPENGDVVIKEEYEPMFSIGTIITFIIIGILLLIIFIMATVGISISWAFGL